MLLLDSPGKERVRLEGYLPNSDFVAALMSGLGRITSIRWTGVFAPTLDNGWYVFGERTPGRKSLKPGDRICFFSGGVDVVADAEVTSVPERAPVKQVKNPEKYPWSFEVRNVRYYFDKPVIIDAAMRAKLDAFKKGDPEAPWGWFVVSTKILTEHDYRLLTNGNPTIAPH